MSVYLIVGLPGAGNTTRARELEVSETALRLTPDEWQMSIFDGDDSTQWQTKERSGYRDRIEGKLVRVCPKIPYPTPQAAGHVLGKVHLTSRRATGAASRRWQALAGLSGA